jgi:hypothetical protein
MKGRKERGVQVDGSGLSGREWTAQAAMATPLCPPGPLRPLVWLPLQYITLLGSVMIYSPLREEISQRAAWRRQPHPAAWRVSEPEELPDGRALL